jgi:hypothetical protein
MGSFNASWVHGAVTGAVLRFLVRFWDALKEWIRTHSLCVKHSRVEPVGYADQYIPRNGHVDFTRLRRDTAAKLEISPEHQYVSAVLFTTIMLD